MHFLIATVAALAGFSAVAAAPSKRAGTITEPVTGTSISTGASIAFNYDDSNWCHEGYTPVTIWLSESAPTALNSTGQLPEGTFIDYFGEYTIANFGISSATCPPPTSLTVPDVSAYSSGSTLFLSVVETAQAGACPPVRSFSILVS
ncbi:hypothetical protein K438DRAFT_1724181 [Mycena galopus ATCC 62051]|nr:hypothetical protein K438DRAFT_1724181 [Mycena galopus ATCC 62051]